VKRPAAEGNAGKGPKRPAIFKTSRLDKGKGARGGTGGADKGIDSIYTKGDGPTGVRRLVNSGKRSTCVGQRQGRWLLSGEEASVENPASRTPRYGLKGEFCCLKRPSVYRFFVGVKGERRKKAGRANERRSREDIMGIADTDGFRGT